MAKAKSKVKTSAKKSVAKKAVKKPAPKAAAKKSAKPVAKKALKVDWADFFTPIGNRVLIEREDAPTKTAGGLFIPDFVQEAPNQARVLVAGPGSRSKSGRLQPLDVRVGDHVLFSSYAGLPIKLQGQDLLLVKEDEIQAVLP